MYITLGIADDGVSWTFLEQFRLSRLVTNFKVTLQAADVLSTFETHNVNQFINRNFPV